MRDANVALTKDLKREPGRRAPAAYELSSPFFGNVPSPRASQQPSNVPRKGDVSPESKRARRVAAQQIHYELVRLRYNNNLTPLGPLSNRLPTMHPHLAVPPTSPEPVDELRQKARRKATCKFANTELHVLDDDVDLNRVTAEPVARRELFGFREPSQASQVLAQPSLYPSLKHAADGISKRHGGQSGAATRSGTALGGLPGGTSTAAGIMMTITKAAAAASASSVAAPRVVSPKAALAEGKAAKAAAAAAASSTAASSAASEQKQEAKSEPLSQYGEAFTPTPPWAQPTLSSRGRTPHRTASTSPMLVMDLVQNGKSNHERERNMPHRVTEEQARRRAEIYAINELMQAREEAAWVRASAELERRSSAARVVASSAVAVAGDEQ